MLPKGRWFNVNNFVLEKIQFWAAKRLEHKRLQFCYCYINLKFSEGCKKKKNYNGKIKKKKKKKKKI